MRYEYDMDSGKRDELGRGNFGVVFLGKNFAKVKCAIKVIPKTTGVREIKHEMQMQRDLSNYCKVQKKESHFLALWDHSLDKNYYYLISPYKEKGSLKQVIENHPNGLPTDCAKRCFQELVRITVTAHEAGKVLRDLKPDQFLLDTHGKLWMCDFGMVTNVTKNGNKGHEHCVGTPEYMAPEVHDLRMCNQKSDVWSLGVILYQLLTGKLPFIGVNQFDVTDAVLKYKPNDLRTGTAQGKLDLDGLKIEHLLHPDPGARLKTSELLQVVNQWKFPESESESAESDMVNPLLQKGKTEYKPIRPDWYTAELFASVRASCDQVFSASGVEPAKTSAHSPNSGVPITEILNVESVATPASDA